MSRDELLVLKKGLKTDLERQFISPSSLEVGELVLFTHKHGGGLQFCIDYRKFNEITIKDGYLLPLIQETLDRLAKAGWFTQLDLTHTYHLVPIAKGDEWKTAFGTRYGHFKYNVIAFKLTNVPATFQEIINEVIQQFLDDFTTAYLDDILISSNSLQ